MTSNVQMCTLGSNVSKEAQMNFLKLKQLLQETRDTLEHIVQSEEWETLQNSSSADILIEEIDQVLEG